MEDSSEPGAAGAARGQLAEPLPTRFVEWLTRRHAIADARRQSVTLTPEHLESLRYAHAALEAASSVVDAEEPLRAGPAPALAVPIAREAVYFALRAWPFTNGAREVTTLEEALDAAERGAAARPVSSPAALADARAALVGFTPATLTRADPAEQWSRGRAAHAAAAHLVADADADVHRLERLVASRWRRIAGSVVALGLVVLGAATALRRPHGPDLAAGMTFRVSSTFPPYPISGNTSVRGEHDLMFHTQSEDQPWVVVDLAEPRTFKEVVVQNRYDCCSDRASPLVLEVSDDGVAFRALTRREGSFDRWEAHVPPTRARYVRLRVDARQCLHLERISVY